MHYLCSFLFRIKVPYPFQWGTPIFRASHVFGMIGAALVTSAEVQLLFQRISIAQFKNFDI